MTWQLKTVSSFVGKETKSVYKSYDNKKFTTKVVDLLWKRSSWKKNGVFSRLQRLAQKEFLVLSIGNPFGFNNFTTRLCYIVWWGIVNMWRLRWFINSESSSKLQEQNNLAEKRTLLRRPNNKILWGLLLMPEDSVKSLTSILLGRPFSQCDCEHKIASHGRLQPRHKSCIAFHCSSWK